MERRDRRRRRARVKLRTVQRLACRLVNTFYFLSSSFQTTCKHVMRKVALARHRVYDNAARVTYLTIRKIFGYHFISTTNCFGYETYYTTISWPLPGSGTLRATAYCATASNTVPQRCSDQRLTAMTHSFPVAVSNVFSGTIPRTKCASAPKV